MGKKTTYAHPANPQRVQAMLELRRSGAAGKHADRRTRRARAREHATRRAVTEQTDD